MPPITVAVLMGGPSSEHEVSLKSGAMVLKALAHETNLEKYRTLPVTISKNGLWKFSDSEEFSAGAALERLKQEQVAAVFIAMHGEFGEDGTIQGFLEVAGIPYTGSGVLASALAMDKQKSSELLRAQGIAVPSSRSLRMEIWNKDQGLAVQMAALGGIPCVVKPASLGSSVGVSIVKDKTELLAALSRAFEAAPEVLIQEYIAGMEVTCGVLDEGADQAPLALSPTEIVPKGGTFFDYEAKYKVGGSEEITPARLPETMIKNIQTVALTAHAILGCRGLSRSDMIIKDKQVYYLETNTLPGMTETSLLPQEAAVVGITFPKLVDRLIQTALRNKK